MITIAIADLNQIYCQGLKTMLEQTGEFTILVLEPHSFTYSDMMNIRVDILMIDEDLFLEDKNKLMILMNRFPLLRIVILTMDHGDPAFHPEGMETIYKGCGKREFSKQIRQIADIKFNPL